MTLKQIHILVYTVSDVFTLHNNKYNNSTNLRTEKWMTLREIHVLAYTVSNIFSLHIGTGIEKRWGKGKLSQGMMNRGQNSRC